MVLPKKNSPTPSPLQTVAARSNAAITTAPKKRAISSARRGTAISLASLWWSQQKLQRTRHKNRNQLDYADPHRMVIRAQAAPRQVQPMHIREDHDDQRRNAGPGGVNCYEWQYPEQIPGVYHGTKQKERAEQPIASGHAAFPFFSI